MLLQKNCRTHILVVFCIILLFGVILSNPVSGNADDPVIVLHWTGEGITNMDTGTEVPLNGTGIYTGFLSTYTNNSWVAQYPSSFQANFGVTSPTNGTYFGFTIPFERYNITGGSEFCWISVPLNTSAMFTFNVTQSFENYTVFVGGWSSLGKQSGNTWSSIDANFTYDLTLVKGNLTGNITTVLQPFTQYVTVTQNVTQFVQNTSYIYQTVTETVVQYMPFLGDPSIWLPFTGALFGLGMVLVYIMRRREDKAGSGYWT